MANIQKWIEPDGIAQSTSEIMSTSSPAKIVSFAGGLSKKQQDQIELAFNMEAYEMAAEFAWRKAIIKLKETLYSLGPKLIGELLGKDDVDEYTSIDEILTDYSAISVAEQLRVIGSTAALKLKQAHETINHHFSKNADEEIDCLTALTIVKTSIQYVLFQDRISVSIEFSQIYERLLSESIVNDESFVDQIVSAPLFYIRTLISMLINAVKNQKGAKLEHASANLNYLIPLLWATIGEKEKWSIGFAYRDVIAEGNKVGISALKSALTKVNGFDYVPETLRSSTYRRAAREVIDTHFSMNNFHNERKVVYKLAQLGSVIPTPALPECLKAYLLVYSGNVFGHSFDAEDIAKSELAKVNRERWKYYFEKIVPEDEVILEQFTLEKPFIRISRFMKEYNLSNLGEFSGDVQKLYKSIINENHPRCSDIAMKMIKKLKYNKMS